MLIFTFKLDKYIKKNLLPKILLVADKCLIKGSFRRKIPYITDIDVVNNVYPEINVNNIYDKLISLIKKIQNDENKNVIMVYITCGADERFKIETGSDEELQKIKSLLTPQEFQQFEQIEKNYDKNFDKKIFYINEMIWEIYKLRWTPQNVLDDRMVLRGGKVAKFTDIVENNTSLLLQYFVKIDEYPIGVDIVVNYKPIDLTHAYQMAALYQLRLANYGKEYYFMLFPLKHYFKDNKSIGDKIDFIIEKKFGLYKQLIVRIDTYHTLYETQNLDIKTATAIITSIIKDTNHLPELQSNVIIKIKQVAQNNPPDVKMSEWSTLLDVLYDEINTTVNLLTKDYFYKYLNMLPVDIQKKYYLPNIRLRLQEQEREKNKNKEKSSDKKYQRNID